MIFPVEVCFLLIYGELDKSWGSLCIRTLCSDAKSTALRLLVSADKRSTMGFEKRTKPFLAGCSLV